MKIAISATAANLDADIDPRFGRCQYFLIVDPATMELESGRWWGRDCHSPDYRW
jgi:predicted Fe-Mo cluster-binding NifX family protein